MFLVWTRLIMPNGRSIVLERQQGADAGGHSGLEDEIDNHWPELFKAALSSTVLGVGSELGAGADNGNNTAILQALRLGAVEFAKSDRTAGRSEEPQYSTDIDNQARLPSERDRRSRSGA